MKVLLETYGCQMNEYDSELIGSILTDRGYTLTAHLDEADVVLLNTCAIRENAYRKVYGRIDLLTSKKNGTKRIVGVLGCMAQNLKEELLTHKGIHLIVGPDNYRTLPDLIENVVKTRQPEISASLSEYETYSDIAPTRKEGVNAWVAIMRGCDNFCTFCVVPYTRGRERSRSMASILEEVHLLVDKGYPQVTLLGQNVNSYRHEGATFADLLEEVAKIPGIRRVRFTSPHPKDFPEELLAVMANHPHICKHIHLPLQAGSNRILDLMNRTYTAEDYLKLVDTIRTLLPTVTLTTDMIVGFPTETEEEFQDTVRIVHHVGFDNAYIFKYSERKGTVAARDYPDDVPAPIKTDRIVRLIEIQRAISLKRHMAYVGQSVPVLLEGPSAEDPAMQMGKTDGHITVICPTTSHAPGEIVSVSVEEATSSALYGPVIQTPSLR